MVKIIWYTTQYVQIPKFTSRDKKNKRCLFHGDLKRLEKFHRKYDPSDD